MGGAPHHDGHTRDITCLAVSEPGRHPWACNGCGLKNLGCAALSPTLHNCAGCQAPSHAKLNTEDYWIISGARDEKCVMWYADTRIRPRNLMGHTGAIFSVAIAKDGLSIVSGAADKKVIIWNTDGTVIKVCTDHNGPTYCVATCVNQCSVSGSADHTLRLWHRDGSLARVMRFHSAAVNCTTHLVDGRIISGCKDGSMAVWTNEGEFLSNLEGHESTVICVVPGPNQGGEFCVVSGSTDHTLRVWNPTTGSCHHILEGHAAPISSVCTNGNLVISGSLDRTVRIWR